MGYDIPSDHHGPLPKNTKEDNSLRDRRVEFPLYNSASLLIQDLFNKNYSRALRWHGGNLNQWSTLEWAGAMCGEAGEAANAAKKLRRVEQDIKSINAEARHLPTIQSAREQVIKEVCDTIMYAVLVAASCEIDAKEFEQALCGVFNDKSEEYGFPERL